MSRKQREIRQREQLILDAAQDMLHEHGYKYLTMDRIAEKVEYSKGTIYNHFASKEDLVCSLSCRCLTNLIDLFQQAHNPAPLAPGVNYYTWSHGDVHFFAMDLVDGPSLEALLGTPVPFDARIHDARPHAGQREAAAVLRELLDRMVDAIITLGRALGWVGTAGVVGGALIWLGVFLMTSSRTPAQATPNPRVAPRAARMALKPEITRSGCSCIMRSSAVR